MISIDAHGGPALPEDRVQAIVRRALARAPSFTSAERDLRSRSKRGLLAATFEYRELPDASDHGRDLLVRLSVEAPEQLAAQLGPEGLDVTVLLERDAGQADLSSDLHLATERLAAILQARTDLARGADRAVTRLLESSDPDALILTLEWVRDHPDHAEAREAANRAVELIEHDDERVALLAIEALGQIGGPEHVVVLLDRIQLADTRQANSAYDALANLGGPEAEGFLQFAARNEDEPRRRAAAERALHRVADSDMIQASSRAPRPAGGKRSQPPADPGLAPAGESSRTDAQRSRPSPTWPPSRGHR
ncbi:hypothetical protein ENSA7_09700 [Enhygromyxa salina]|uniref:HEAT repeat protein n=1 Tax=Enhygromyxa salina TaxID=215803 RepID=A0A2S9YVZ7_9BACT|nr:hypothetical protein ENSA7_09700 [Enhygromyxa salina]